MQDILHAILDEARGVLRFRLPAIIAAWATCLVGWGIVLVLPDVYQAGARVFADTRTALAPVIQGLAIQQDVTAQLNLVEQSLLGEEQLDRVIKETDLREKATTPAKRAKIMQRLREQIDIQVFPSSQKTDTGGSVYWLSYRDSDRDRTLKVVDILLNAFVKDTVSGKLANSEAAQRFLSEQIKETELQLRAAEQRLAGFKKRNIDTMPGAEGDYFTRLQTEIDAARTARTALSVAVSRRDELSKQLRDGAMLAARSGVAPPPTSDRSAARDTLTQLAEAQAKLDALLRQFTERHPDVGALRETIAQLKEQHERELEALRRGDDDTALPAGVTSNPVYQSVRLALNQANVEVAALGRELSAHESKVAELRRLVNSMPEVEAEFARLNRDYDVHKSQYVALVDRLEKAKLGQDAESIGSGVRLEILDPPTAPFGPVAPNRPALLLVVFMFACGAAVALAFVLSKLNPVFNHSRDLEKITGLPVLGEVSLTWLEKYNRTTRRLFLGYSAAAGALFLVCATLVMIQVKAH